VRLEKLRASAGNWTRAQSQSLHDLSRDQQSLTGETSQLAEKLAGAQTFRFVLDAAAREMTGVVDRLAGRDCGEATQRMEQNVLSRLKRLVEAMKEDKPPPGDSQGGGGSGGSGSKAGQPGGSIRALAELKLIKLMQDDLNRRTQQLGETIGDREPTDSEQAELSQLAKEQGQLAELMLGLVGGQQ